MFQNVKVDVVYYKTNTDFEMEFNLCGCCRMRLLTDKAPDRRTLVHSLARAVSRSKVIIVVGVLFGEESIINTVAGAIGSKTEIADNKASGINSKDEIEIISGSTPLVTPEGYFGGCIIENGPQTMILLSESKNIRKPIMQTLIHPYIEQLCADELTERANAVPPEPLTDIAVPVTEPVAEAVVEPETVEALEEAEKTEEPAEEEAVTDTIEENTEEAPVEEETEAKVESENEENEESSVEVSGGMIFEEENELITEDSSEDGGLYAEPMSMNRRQAKLLNETYAQLEDGELDVDEENIVQGYRRNLRFDLPMLIIAIVLLVLVAVLSYCIFYIPAKNGISSGEYIREIFDVLFKAAS